jgi:hypothetical protein
MQYERSDVAVFYVEEIFSGRNCTPFKKAISGGAIRPPQQTVGRSSTKYEWIIEICCISSFFPSGTYHVQSIENHN